MHAEFPDWYAEVQIEPNPDMLAGRWQSAASYGEGLTAGDVPGLVRIARALLTDDAPAVVALRDHMRDDDPAFRARDNRQELAIIAAAALVTCYVEGSSNSSAAAALLISAGVYVNGPPVVTSLVSESHRYIADTALTVRRPIRPTPATLPKAVGEALAQLSSGSVTSVEELRPGFADLGSALEQFGTNLRNATNRVSQYVKAMNDVVSEQSDLLWWLFGDEILNSSTRYANLKRPAVPLVAGVDVGRLSRFAVPPRSASEFASHKLHALGVDSDATTTLEEAVDALPSDWLESTVEETSGIEEVQDLVPLHACLLWRARAAEGWPSAVRKQTAFDPAIEIGALELALATMSESSALQALQMK